MSRLGQSIIQGLQDARAIARGEMEPARAFNPEPFDVVSIRKRLRLSQGKFAARFGLSVSTLRDWEQGRRQPDRYARALLKVIDHAPETVERAMAAALTQTPAPVPDR